MELHSAEFRSSSPLVASGQQQTASVDVASKRVSDSPRSSMSSARRRSSSRRNHHHSPYVEPTPQRDHGTNIDYDRRQQRQSNNRHEPERVQSRRCLVNTTATRREVASASPSFASVNGCRDRVGTDLVQGLPPVSRSKSTERSASHRSRKLLSPRTTSSPRSREHRTSSAFRIVGIDERRRRNSSSGSESPSSGIHHHSSRRPVTSPSALSSRETLISSRSFRPIRTASNVVGPVENPIPRRPFPRVSTTTDAAITGSPPVFGRRSISSDTQFVRQMGKSIPLLCRTPLVIAIFVVAFMSPVAMLSLSAIRSFFDGDNGEKRLSLKCSTTDCQSSIMFLGVRLILAAFCLVAAFFHCNSARTCCGRRQTDGDGSSTTLPRLETIEVGLVCLVALDAVVFWSFYTVRVLSAAAAGSDGSRDRADVDFQRTLAYATSMADSLVFVVGLTILVVQLGISAMTSSYDDDRSVCSGEARYGVRILRSSDGWSVTFTVGETSIQRLALHCLRRQSVFGSGPSAGVPPSDTDDAFNNETCDVKTTSSARTANTWSGSTAYDRERRIARRRAQLLTAAEEAYSRVVVRQAKHRNHRSLDNGVDGNAVDQSVEAGLIRPDEAAAEGVCMAVHGYLRAIGQRRMYSRQEVLDRLDWCLTNGASTDVFIHKYLCLEQSEVQVDTSNARGHGMCVTDVTTDNRFEKCLSSSCSSNDTESWMLACSVPANSSIGDGTNFILRDSGEAVGCQSLTVEVRRLPNNRLVPLNDREY